MQWPSVGQMQNDFDIVYVHCLYASKAHYRFKRNLFVGIHASEHVTDSGRTVAEERTIDAQGLKD